jgi:hypothetical protein
LFPQEKLRKPLLREECRKKTLLKEVKPAAVAGEPLNQYRQLLYGFMHIQGKATQFFSIMLPKY